MKHKNPPAASVPRADELRELIHRQNKPLRLDTLLKLTRLPRQAKGAVLDTLAELEKTGSIHRLPGSGWVSGHRLKTREGVFQPTETGGIVIPEGGDRDSAIAIPPLYARGAWRNDSVRVALMPGSHNRSGKIIEILERANRITLARVEAASPAKLRCRATDRSLPVIFETPLADAPASPIDAGSLISVEAKKELAPGVWLARLVNVFGDETRVDVQEAIVKATLGVPGEFPALALAEAKKACAEQPVAGASRMDLRHIPFVTIDGADAKDFDDAIHVEKLKDGWRLRVAIADVAHYVRPGGSLDAEALRRGNSWYFPRSVEPMLPEMLSNGLCSLRPGEDRLAVLAVLDIGSTGHVQKEEFSQILMRSKARLTYDEVESFFKSGLPGAIDEETADMLLEARRLYETLADMRRRRGALDFELPEPAYAFNPDGSLKTMSIAQRGDSNRLIEEFMIAANEAVARFIGQTASPFLYRVHPEPAEQKLTELFQTLRQTAAESLPAGIGQQLPVRAIQEILQRAAGTPQEYVVNKLCLRAMQQARYQPENEGHFGLASPDYCHFTSPIRRYADLLTHRALKSASGAAAPELPDRQALTEIGDQLNKLERRAMECERDMARRLGCIAARELEGRVVEGTISGVTEFGAFVELSDLPTEGLMRLSTLGNDWFELDSARQCLAGRHTGQVWRLGQAVQVLVSAVDLDRLEIRLEPAGRDAPRFPRQARHKNAGRKRISADRAPRSQARKGRSEPGPDRPCFHAKRKRGR